MIPRTDRRGVAPPINGRAPAASRTDKPCRVHRTKRRANATPEGAIYVGRPTLWGNPFSGRPKIGHARSVILYRAWIAGDLTVHILTRAGFSEAEIFSLIRWRLRLLARLDDLRGHDLQCWCPLSSAWCHADVLLHLANDVHRQAA